MTSEAEARCPICGGANLTFGYGFAGGGLGPYTICLDCDCIVAKHRTEQGTVFNWAPGDDEAERE